MNYKPKLYRQVNKNETWAGNILRLHLHERGGCMATTIPAKLSNNMQRKNYIFTCDCKASDNYQYISPLLDLIFFWK